VNSVAWNGSFWVAGGNTGGSEGALAYSYDGDTWNPAVTYPSNFTCYSVVWNGIMWLAGGDNFILCYSYDGINWYQVNSPPAMNIIYTIAWNGSMWVAGGESPYIYYSYDGQIWNNKYMLQIPIPLYIIRYLYKARDKDNDKQIN
jgi:hypothetical protein